MAAACPMIADKVIAACRQTDAPKAAVVTERSAPLLSIRGLSVRFGGIVALDNVSFNVKARQIYGLIGPNGAGKTTLFNCLSRLYQPCAGTIHFAGEPLLKLSRHRATPGLPRCSTWCQSRTPKLLLLDEPSFGLAPLVVQEIFRILRTINRNEGVSMLLVEQNAHLALELADHAYLIETGCIVISGPAASIAREGATRRAYLGY
jgi:ABC-type branched-subunit amino acid transport system ATPase component